MPFVWLSSCLAQLFLSSHSLLSSTSNTHLKYFSFPKLFLRTWSKNPWSYFKKPTISGLLKQKQYSLTHPYFSMRQTILQQRLRRLKWWRREWGAQTTQTWKRRFLFSTLVFVTASPKHIALWLTSHSLHSWFHVLFMLLSFSQKLPSLPLGTLKGFVSPLVFVSYASCVRLCTHRSLSISAVTLDFSSFSLKLPSFHTAQLLMFSLLVELQTYWVCLSVLF